MHNYIANLAHSHCTLPGRATHDLSRPIISNELYNAIQHEIQDLRSQMGVTAAASGGTTPTATVYQQHLTPMRSVQVLRRSMPLLLGLLVAG